MANAELIKALQCASHFALYQDCYEKNCYANSGKGLYCNIPKLIEDAADALEADEKRIAELERILKAVQENSGINFRLWQEAEAQMQKEGEWIEDATTYAGPGLSNYKCSLCGKICGTWRRGLEPSELPNWCGNCGADMRAKMEVQE